MCQCSGLSERTPEWSMRCRCSLTVRNELCCTANDLISVSLTSQSRAERNDFSRGRKQVKWNLKNEFSSNSFLNGTTSHEETARASELRDMVKLTSAAMLNIYVARNVAVADPDDHVHDAATSLQQLPRPGRRLLLVQANCSQVWQQGGCTTTGTCKSHSGLPNVTSTS